MGVCDHFLKGNCNYGDACWKLHVAPTTKEKKVEVKKEEVDERPYCDHFQRGVCTFGAACWKRHEMLPLYKAEFAPTVEERVGSRGALEENFNTVQLNSARSTPCSDEDLFFSDSDDESKPVVRKSRRLPLPPRTYTRGWEPTLSVLCQVSWRRRVRMMTTAASAAKEMQTCINTAMASWNLRRKGVESTYQTLRRRG